MRPLAPTSPQHAPDTALLHKPAVVIFGPPWPHSGTSLVMRNQVQYYRDRGFFTVFIAVPFFWYYTTFGRNSTKLVEAMSELGADCTFVATLHPKRYSAAKYKASIRHAFYGTALDWLVAIGRAARLPEEQLDFLRQSQVTLFHVNHVYTIAFALDLRKRLYGNHATPPILLETHDVQSHTLHQRKERNPWTRKPDSLKRLMKSEIALLEKADVFIHVSVQDQELFQPSVPSKPHFLIFPTIDENFISAVNGDNATTPNIDLLFVGSCHPTNLVGLQWFFEQVWPFISERGYHLKIVGEIAALFARELPQLYNKFRSCFIGEVPEVISYYRSSRCIIAPMVSGTGIAIKTIEALALGKPFVGTTKAFRGMPMDRLRKLGIEPCDEPRAFADGIVQALSREQQAGTVSRAAYRQLFSGAVSYRTRDEAIRAVTASDPTFHLQKV
jgi:polysaccharide biosynthesis protein PslH